MIEVTTSYIVNKELPITQNFKLLREEGLALIQDVSDYEWTNLNPSDPGVTILDQICYALTELGYCNDFPVKDILTTVNGDLVIENQYYLPENILTTSPISIEDYIKYLIDRVDYVTNAVIVPIKSSISSYMVYLHIDKSITNIEIIKSICKTAYYTLNNSRNLCETFVVNPLEKIEVLLSGQIDIGKDIDVKSLLSEIQVKLDNYIFSNVQQKGYDKLKEEGIPTNTIFNGPILQNGWILSQDIKPKKNKVFLTEVNALMTSVNGVEVISQLKFYNTKDSTVINSLDNQVVNIDIIESVNANRLKISRNGKDIKDQVTEELIETAKKTYQLETNVELKSVSAICLGPDLPKGTYRDINNYYSIQNTLPEIYRVGVNAIDSGASNYQIAQSRQLMGYLTLVDQVLANQFSQLANISKLFSFKNTMTGDPSDSNTFYNTNNDPQKMKGSYPVPFESFSPTYFYQSLYDIPQIKPLLKSNDIFNFSVKYISKKDLDKRSWKDYIKDPYNSYIWGIKNYIEDDEISFSRRNEILNHLLARHGESPLVIDAIIDGSKYTGDKTQDQVIFKSLLLQNLGLLSYYRQKAYNFKGADKITLPEKEEFEEIELTNDFIFNSEQVDNLEKLSSNDFLNYSAIELKLSLLFGLKSLYSDFITNPKYGISNKTKNSIEASDLEIEQAKWLIQKRKGCILIETNLLFQVAKFRATIIQNVEDRKCYWTTAKDLKYEDAMRIHNWLNTSNTKTIKNQLNDSVLKIDGKLYQLKQIEAYPWDENWIQQPLNTSEYLHAIKADWGKDICTYLENPHFNNVVDIYFPDYIETINNDNFKDRLGLFLESSGPVQIEFRRHYLPAIELWVVILLFNAWHNRLIYQDPASTKEKAKKIKQKILVKNARKLVKQIIKNNSKSK
ncbi:hypothetical protein [uncultured Winogradskyella sp.]|uniref:hypothetical protein n=1 Tax=uncultured Winogradskyella sp. TaxID=395353 RepID=UPI00262622CD|nr:hypothetical protein [uncultured Winogradskyella sp.]